MIKRLPRPLNGGSRREGNHLLFVDPGINATGYCIAENGADKPLATGVVRSKSDMEMLNKCWYISCGIAKELNQLSIARLSMLIIESPQVWGSSKSQASTRAGDLFKLVYCAAYVAALIGEAFQPTFTGLVFPSDWKGQLPKSVVLKRIERQLKEKYRDHEADAVGMWLSYEGRL